MAPAYRRQAIVVLAMQGSTCGHTGRTIFHSTERRGSSNTARNRRMSHQNIVSLTREMSVSLFFPSLLHTEAVFQLCYSRSSWPSLQTLEFAQIWSYRPAVVDYRV